MNRRGVLTLPTLRSPVGRLMPRGRTLPFSPADIAGLAVWAKADGALWQDTGRTTPATANLQPVAVWDDASGLGRHLTQATGTKQPLYMTNQRATLPAVRFDATDDWLQNIFTLNQPVTGFLVCRFPSTTNRYLLDGTGATAGTKGSVGSFSAGTARLHGGTALTTPTGWTANAWVVISWVLNGGSSEVYMNGALSVSGAAGANVMAGLTLASNSGLSGGSSGTDYGEVLLYSGALSTTNRQSVENYLLAKWMAPKEPYEVPGCTAWYRGDNPVYSDVGGTVVSSADGDPVALWTSKLGGAPANITQGVTSSPDRRPKFKPGLVNGKNAIRFDGVDDYLGTGTFLSSFITAATGVVYSVFRPNGFTQMGNEAANSYLADTLWSDVNAQSGLTMTGTTPLLHAWNSEVGATTAPVDVDYARQGVSAGQWYMHRWRHVGGVLTSKRSGAAEVSVASGNWTTTGAFRLGTNYNTAFFANMDLAELFCYNVDPSPADLAALELYLTQRYQLSW